MIEILGTKETRKIQVIIDISMTISLLFLMAYSMIGEVSHEWLGIVMFMLFITHHVLNRRWFRMLFKGRYTPIRIFGTVINISLLIIMLSLMASGIMMSRHTFDFLSIYGNSSSARVLHLLSSYWGFVLLSIHMGLHWGMVMSRIREMVHITKHITAYKCFLRLATICLCGYGIYIFIDRQLIEYMFLKTEFIFLDFNEPLLSFIADYLSMMFLFGATGYYLGKLLRMVYTHFV